MIVADSTTLSAFVLLGRLDLVPKLLGEVAVADAVWNEVESVVHALDPACQMPPADRLEVCGVDVGAPSLSHSESETLELGRIRKAKILLSDDPVVRREARSDRLRPLGTVGLLYAAAKKGLVGDVGELMDRLDAVGYRFSERCRQALLGALRQG